MREAAEMMAPLQDKSLTEILRSLIKMNKVTFGQHKFLKIVET